jgi:hypothetical protein
VISMDNLQTFYDDHITDHLETFMGFQVHRRKDDLKVDPLQMDIIGAHMIYILKKL